MQSSNKKIGEGNILEFSTYFDIIIPYINLMIYPVWINSHIITDNPLR